jgi:ankyrin repeat protein
MNFDNSHNKNSDNSERFFEAIVNGDFGKIDEILEKNLVDVNKEDDDGDTPLMLAFYILIGELSNNANNNNMNKNSQDIINDHKYILHQLILQPTMNVNIINDKGDTPLILAIKHNLDDIFEFLLEKPDINLNLQDKEGRTAIMKAVELNQMNFVNKLLKDNRVDLHIQNEQGDNILTYAIEQKNINVIDFLLTKLDPTHKDNYENTFVHILVENSNEKDRDKELEIIHKLLSKNINANDKNIFGDTPLHFAVDKNSLHLVRFLLQNNVNINEKNKKGETPYSLAIQLGRIDILTVMEQSPQVNNYKKNQIRKIVSKGIPKINSTVKNPNIRNINNVKNIIIPLGHSTENVYNPRSFMKENNMLVVNTSCGLTTTLDKEGITELLNNIQGFQFYREIYEKPVFYQKQIEKTLKQELKIYGKDDKYPNIEFILLRRFNDMNGILLKYSGLVPIDNFSKMDSNVNMFFPFEKINSYTFFRDTISSLFKYSVYPTMNQVKEYFKDEDSIKKLILKYLFDIIPNNQKIHIQKYKQNLDTFTLGNDIYTNFVLNMDRLPIFKITLEQIYEKYPGIVYQFMCRGSYKTKDNIYKARNKAVILQRWESNLEEYKKFVEIEEAKYRAKQHKLDNLKILPTITEKNGMNNNNNNNNKSNTGTVLYSANSNSNNNSITLGIKRGRSNNNANNKKTKKVKGGSRRTRKNSRR